MMDIHSSKFRGRYEVDPSLEQSKLAPSSSSSSSISRNLHLITNNKDCIIFSFSRKLRITSKLIFSSIHRTYISIGIILIFSRIISQIAPVFSLNSNVALSSTVALNKQSMIQQALIVESNTNSNNNKTVIIKRRNKSIPYIIHQSHEESSSLPLEYTNTEIIWKSHFISKHNINVEYRYWTHKDKYELIKEHYPWFLSTYESYLYPVQRYHAAKYFILLKYGGMWCDLNILPVKNILPLFDTIIQDDDDQEVVEMIIAQIHYKDKYTNSLFASIPNSSLLLAFTHSILPKASTITTKTTTIDSDSSTSSIFSLIWKKLIFHSNSRWTLSEETVGSKIFTTFLNTKNKRKWNIILPNVWGQVCDPCQSTTLFCNNNNNNQEESSYFITTTTASSSNKKIYDKWESIFIPYIQCRIELMTWMYILLFICIIFIFRFIIKISFYNNNLQFIICKRKNINKNSNYSKEIKPLMITNNNRNIGSNSSSGSMMKINSSSSNIVRKSSSYFEKNMTREEFVVCIVITLILWLL